MPIDPILGSAAIQAGSGLLGMVAGQGQTNAQYGQQKDLMALQLKNQKELNNQGAELSYQNWLRTNYSAQREQMEKAGLNVGMMYGGGGAGGTLTGGSGGSASGGQAPAPNNQMAMMLSDLMANVELKKAQARNLNVDSDNKEKPIRTGLELENRNKELQNIWQQYDNDMKAYDANRQPEMGRLALEKLSGEAQKAVSEGRISAETAENQIKLAELEVFEKQINNDLTNQKIDESKENVKLIAQKVQESIEWLKQNDRSVTAEEVKAEAQKRLADFGTGTGAQIERGSRVLGNSVDAVMKVYKPRPTLTKVEDYDGSDKSYRKTTTTK